MTAQDFHDINTVFRKLSDVLSHARYGNGRAGLVPPTDVEALRDQIAEALDTITMLSDA